MKCISVLQPWAWLLAHGYKDVENRTWYSRYHGPFAIHAGKRFDDECRRDLAALRERFPSIVFPPSFECGGFVGLANASGSVTTSTSRWFSGPHGILVDEARPIAFIPYRGQLGWFEVPDEIFSVGVASTSTQGSLL